MAIWITKHAAEQMLWREITEAQLKALMRNRYRKTVRNAHGDNFRAKVPGSTYDLMLGIGNYQGEVSIKTAIFKGKPDPRTPRPTLKEGYWLEI